MSPLSLNSTSNPTLFELDSTAKASPEVIRVGRTLIEGDLPYRNELFYKNKTVIFECKNLFERPQNVDDSLEIEIYKLKSLQQVKISVDWEAAKELFFLTDLKEKEKNNIMTAIAAIYEFTGPLIDTKQWFTIDSLINFFMYLKFELKTTIALLTATNTKREFISQRPNLLAYANSLTQKLGFNNEDSNNVLKGL